LAMKAPPICATFGIANSVKFPRILRAPEIFVRALKPLISERAVLFSIWIPPAPIVFNEFMVTLVMPALPLMASPVTEVKLGAEIPSISLKRKLKVPLTVAKDGMVMVEALRKVKSPRELSRLGNSIDNP